MKASARTVQPGETLFTKGDRNCDFLAVLAGTVALVESRGTPGSA